MNQELLAMCGGRSESIVRVRVCRFISQQFQVTRVTAILPRWHSRRVLVSSRGVAWQWLVGKHLSDPARRLVRRAAGDGVSIHDLGKLVGYMRVRATGRPPRASVQRALRSRQAGRPRRRGPGAHFNGNRLAKLDRLVKKWQGYAPILLEVSADFLRRQGRFTCSRTCVVRALHRFGFKARPPLAFRDPT